VGGSVFSASSCKKLWWSGSASTGVGVSHLRQAFAVALEALEALAEIARTDKTTVSELIRKAVRETRQLKWLGSNERSGITITYCSNWTSSNPKTCRPKTPWRNRANRFEF
jgi:hypothetical protein